MARRLLIAPLLCLAFLSPQAGRAQDGATSAVTFDKVAPIFKKRCGSCHAAERPRGGLDLTSLAGIKAGSTSGEVVNAGHPDQSPLFTLAAHLDAPKMPPNAPKIPQRELDLIESWIAGGASDIAGKKMAAAPTSEEESPAVAKPEPAPLVESVKPLQRASAITAFDLRPRSTMLAVSGDLQIVLLDCKTREPLRAFPFPEGEVCSLRFSQDGQWLVASGGVGASEGIVVIFEVDTGKRLFEIKEEGDAILAVDLSPAKDRLAWGGSNKKITLYSLAEKKAIGALGGYTDWVLAVKFSPDGLLLAGSDRFGGIRVWEAKTGKEFWVLRGHTGPVSALAWSPDSNELLTAGEDATARLFNMHSGIQVSVLEPKLGGIKSTDWNENGAIALAGRGGKAAIVDARGQTQREFDLADEACEVVIDPEHKNLIVSDAAGNLATFAMIDGGANSAFTLPVAAASARTATSTWPKRTRAAREAVPVEAAASAAAASQSDELAIAAQEAEAAVQAAEAALVKLRENSTRLKRLLEERSVAKH